MTWLPNPLRIESLEGVSAIREHLIVRLTLICCICCLCAAYAVTDIHRIGTLATGDFEHFYFASDALWRGADPYAAHTQGYIYPPLIAFVFQPLSLLSYQHAAAVMLGINVIITVLTAILAVDEFLRRLKILKNGSVTLVIVLTALLLNIDKVKGEWQMWQTDIWMLLLFVMALRWIDRLPWAAGLALGMGVNIKYIPLIFLPYFLVRQRWQAAIWFVTGIAFFAILPAISTGWSANIRNWKTATNGIVHMTDLHPMPGQSAQIHDVKDSLSCSITSAMARAAGSNAALGFAMAGMTLLIFIAITLAMYPATGNRLLAPSNTYPGIVTGVEWVMLIATALAFAPQTNTRHLYDALIFTSAACVLLLFGRSHIKRWPLIIGTAILFFGFILPPGSRTFHGERTATTVWLRSGGPCWCLMIAALTLLWTGLRETNYLPVNDNSGNNRPV